MDNQSNIELWQHLNNKLFRRLDPTQTSTVGRLESGFLKLYVINCIQTRHHDKLKVLSYLKKISVLVNENFAENF